MNQNLLSGDEEAIIRRLQELQPSKKTRVIRAVLSAAMGSVPWVGSLIAAYAAFNQESSQLEVNSLQGEWLREHKTKFEKLAQDLNALSNRLQSFGDEVLDRIQSEEYLALIRKGFRIWDQADTDQKKSYIGKLLANAGGAQISNDDIVRLFLDWLETYHEAHFQVIREVYKNPGSTRYEIWQNIHGEFPADNSSEADLFRMLIGDLSQGRIIRQHREVNSYGQFMKKPRVKSAPGSGSSVMKSAFDNEEPYELTELGKKFVHYVFSEVVKRIDQTTNDTGI